MVQFNETISYAAGKLEIECFEQTLIASCESNCESDLLVTNFHIAEFWQPFQQCRALVHYKRIELVFRLSPAWHRHDTCMFMAWLSSRAQSIVHHLPTWCFVTFTNGAIWLVPHFFLRQLTMVLIINVTRPSPARKRREEPREEAKVVPIHVVCVSWSCMMDKNGLFRTITTTTIKKHWCLRGDYRTLVHSMHYHTWPLAATHSDLHASNSSNQYSQAVGLCTQAVHRRLSTTMSMCTIWACARLNMWCSTVCPGAMAKATKLWRACFWDFTMDAVYLVVVVQMAFQSER